MHSISKRRHKSKTEVTTTSVNMVLTLIVSIGASHDGTVWEHVDVAVGALAVEAH